jgi:ParB family transcriptional regulator, chromosome partitioning protein
MARVHAGTGAAKQRIIHIAPGGRSEVPVQVIDADDLHRELAEIDEDPIRAELNVLEQGEHLARRDELLMELGLRADQSNNGGTGKYAVTGATVAPVKTTADLGAEIGLSKRAMQRDQ